MPSSRRWRLAALVVSLASLAFGVGFCVSPGQAAIVGHVPGRVLVKFRAGTSASAVTSAHAAAQGRALGRLAHLDVDVVDVPSRLPLRQAMSYYAGNPDVEFVELDGIAEPDVTPNDPTYLSQWHLPKIGGPAAWDTVTGSAAITIAILDTGVDPTHPDLAGKLVPGWNTYDGNADTHDVYGHGTSTAGAAAAMTNNGQGVASVAWGCRIMPIRISDTTGYGYYSTAASGLTWAADHGARVANISYEFTGSSTVQSAAKYFQSKGGVVTVSAGNGNTALTISDSPYLLTVGATDTGDARASFSNTGNVIDLVAPGVSITTTANGGGYRTASGTSFSAPIVAGVAALVLSTNPNLSPAEVETILEQSADDLGMPGRDTQFGAGRVNAARAVAAAWQAQADTQAPAVAFSAPGNGATLSGAVTVQVSVSDNRGVASASLSLDGGEAATLTAAPYAWSWDTNAVANGTHTLTATATDTSGNVATATITVTVANVVLGPTDTTPPTVAITSPISGSRAGSRVRVGARASDNVGVVRVDLYVDRALTATSTSSAPSFSVSAGKWARGTHLLEAVAYDAAGNLTWSAPVMVIK